MNAEAVKGIFKAVVNADIPQEVKDEMIPLIAETVPDLMVYKVSYRVMLNKGHYENGGTSYFWTYEDAEKFVDLFKNENDGWASDIDEPEETEFICAELDEMMELLLEGKK